MGIDHDDDDDVRKTLSIMVKVAITHPFILMSSFLKGHQSFFIVRSKVVLFMFTKGFLQIFVACIFLFGANFQKLSWI